jgi:hypothetical protein
MTKNRKMTMMFAGAVALVTAVVLRGLAPELLRYMRIRRM